MGSADFQAMHANVGIPLKAQSHLAVADVEHRQPEQGLKAARSADDHGFLAFPRQDQQNVASAPL
jgi:hypothetical protein